MPIARHRGNGARIGGSKGARLPPWPDRYVQRRVCWLPAITGPEASPGRAAETPLRASPGTASTGPSRTASPASWSPISRATRASPSSVAMAGLTRRPPAFGLSLPLGDRRSCVGGAPAARRSPEKPPDRPETGSEPVETSRRDREGRIRLHCPNLGPPDTRPTAPSGHGGARRDRIGRTPPPPCCGPRAPAPPP